MVIHYNYNHALVNVVLHAIPMEPGLFNRATRSSMMRAWSGETFEILYREALYICAHKHLES